MIFASLASGSSGNCTLAAANGSAVLIDCGVSAKRIKESLAALGIEIGRLDGIFLTHEHSDHIKGLKRMMSAFGVPVYASEGTLSALAAVTRDEYFQFAGRALMHAIPTEHWVELGAFRIQPFCTSHDAKAPYGYRIETAAEPKQAVGVMTDTGYFSDEMRDHLTALDAVLLEANHDRTMLTEGPYPPALKRRIMSQRGHLSNNAAGQLLSEILSPRLHDVLLGHMSKDNNTSALAIRTVEEEVAARCGSDALHALTITVAPHDGISRVIRIGETH